MFKHIGQLTNNTGFWNSTFRPVPGKRNEPHHPRLWEFLQYEDVLREHSDYGFVGMSAQYDYRRVALHSCGGYWWGCIPQDAAALVQHHGRQRASKEVIQGPLMRVLHMWLALAIDRSRMQEPALAGAGAGAAAATAAPAAPSARRLMS